MMMTVSMQPMTVRIWVLLKEFLMLLVIETSFILFVFYITSYANKAREKISRKVLTSLPSPLKALPLLSSLKK